MVKAQASASAQRRSIIFLRAGRAYIDQQLAPRAAVPRASMRRSVNFEQAAFGCKRNIAELGRHLARTQQRSAPPRGSVKSFTRAPRSAPLPRSANSSGENSSCKIRCRTTLASRARRRLRAPFQRLVPLQLDCSGQLTGRRTEQQCGQNKYPHGKTLILRCDCRACLCLGNTCSLRPRSRPE